MDMDITKEKVNELFKELRFRIPVSPESALSKALEIINKNPNIKNKVITFLEELRKRLSASGGNWDEIKDWVYSLFAPRNAQPVEAASEQSNKAKFIPLVQGTDDVLTNILYGLLSKIQKDREILKDYEKVIGPRLKRENISIPKISKEFCMHSKISLVLDSAANYLESRGLIKQAYAIDKIADATTSFLLKQDSTPENRKEAEGLKAKIIPYIQQKGRATAHDIYKDLECGDIPMYLALHDLVKEKKIKGDDPYKELKSSHKDYLYTI
jgi:hypothetical protein